MESVKSVYKETKNHLGTKKPLFDRLIDDTPHIKQEKNEKNYLDKEALEQSIIRELTTLFNARLPLSKKDYDFLASDSIHFGLPFLFGIRDLSSFDVFKRSEWRYFSKLCEKAIKTHEPRLNNPKVEIKGVNKRKQCLNITISGGIKLQNFDKVVTFSLAIDWMKGR